MTIQLPAQLEEEIRRMAGREGCGAEELVEKALRQYLEVDAIRDVTPAEIGLTQMALSDELRNLPAWADTQEPPGHEAH